MEEDSIRHGMPQFARRTFVAFSILAVLSAAIYGLGARYGDRMATIGHTTDTAPLEIIIGNDAYNIPTNMIRQAEQRVGGVAERLDIYVYWPTQSGYATNLMDKFSDVNPKTIEIVVLSLSKRNSLLDMAERFEPVYKNAISTQAIKKISGELYGAPLRSEFGYINEQLFFSPNAVSSKPNFIARCQDHTKDKDPLLLACETDQFIGKTTQIKIRFALNQLQRWEKFSAELAKFSDEILVSD